MVDFTRLPSPSYRNAALWKTGCEVGVTVGGTVGVLVPTGVCVAVRVGVGLGPGVGMADDAVYSITSFGRWEGVP